MEEMVMSRVMHELFRSRDRVSPIAVRVLFGLTFTSLLLAVGAAFSYEGGHRIAAVSAFTLMALGNLANGLGSVVPEERGGRALRLLTAPVAALMFIALVVALLYQFDVL